MNGETKKVIKHQLINWFGVAIVCFISFYFTANAKLKEHDKDIKMKLDTELFDEYVKGIHRLIESNYELISRDTENNKEQIELLRKSNDEIRADIRTLYNQLGFRSRGIKFNSVE